MSVLVVDDHAGFRASARTLLELDGFEVVAEAADGATGLALAEEVDPDLILLDVALPDTNGFDVAEHLRGRRARVILVSSRERSDYERRVRQSGALGFVSKDQLSGAAVRALLRGG